MDNSNNSLAVCIDCTKNSNSDLNDLLLKCVSPLSSDFVPYLIDDNVQVRPFHLDTKYYTADLGICKLVSPTVGSEQFADRVEAVLFHFESDISTELQKFSETSKLWLQTLEQWMIYVKHWEPNVCMLVFNRVPSDEKHGVLSWCVKNEFELVELNPDEDTLQEIENCNEVYGVRRIVQVLKAHGWPNLELKDESVENEERSKRLRELLGEEDPADFAICNPSDACDGINISKLSTDLEKSLKLKQNGADKISAENHSKHVDAMLRVDDDPFVAMATGNSETESSDGSFEELFAKFAAFKATAENLPENQRKEFAEKVTLAFWRSIGGDEDEIAEADDSDSETKS